MKNYHALVPRLSQCSESDIMSGTIYFDTKSSSDDVNDCLACNGIAVISDFFW